jgi:uncharacterized protein
MTLMLVRGGRAAIVALACLAFAGTARAQQPTPGAIAAAKELLAAKGAMTMFDPLVPGIIETVKNNHLQTNTSLSKDLNEVAALLRTEFAPRRGEVIDEVAAIYARRFSEQELKDVVAFYKTPAGKKFVTEEPLAIDESLQRAQVWSQKLSEEVLTRFRAEMKKRGHDL